MDDQSLELSRPFKRHRGQSSSSFAATDMDYDVFLNHCGPVVKDSFISRLEEALRAAGLNPFLDKAPLREGHPVFRSINDALEVAKIYVAVVSKGYAESKYCLNELVAILDMVAINENINYSRKHVIPVFYDVEPKDLRWVENGLGPFAAAFEKHMLEEKDWNRVERWRGALLKLADISGLCFRLSDHKGSVAELTQKADHVVNWVLSFFPGKVEAEGATKLEGLQSFIFTIMSELGIQQKPRKQEVGVEQLKQIFEGNVYGVVAGRLDTRTMQVQVILSDLKTMVDLTGVGFETQKLVTVTLGGDLTKVIMSVFEETDCENSSANPFYLLHLDEDVVANQNHSVGRQGDFLSHPVYRVHILAKLLLLVECEELGDEILWLRIKELLPSWNLKTLRTAILEFESISKGDGRYQERGSGAGTEKGGCSQHSNPSFSNDCRNRNARRNQDTPADEKNEDLASGGDDKEDSSGGKNKSTESSDSMDQESISIEVRPGFNTFKKKMGEDWSYKSIRANVTPRIIVSFLQTVPFRSGPNKTIKGREVHMKLEVNLELGDTGPVCRERDGQFAWFHDYFEFSIQCMAKKAAQLKPCSGLIHELKDQKVTRGRSSTLNSGQASIQGQGGLRLGPSTLAQATGQVSYSRTGESTTIQVEEAIDSNRIQSAQGFNVVHNFGGGKMPKIGGRFSYGDTNIGSQCLREDGTCKKWAYNLPICSSQDVTIEGTFQPLEDGEPYYKYTLNCKRDIKGWFWEELKETKEKKRLITSKFSSLSCMSAQKSVNVDAVRSSKDDKLSVTKTWIEQIFEQAFDFDIYINHAMLHIYELAAQHPRGIPAIGPRDGYENLIQADSIYPVKEYMEKTHGETHSGYTLELLNAFKLQRDGESERFKPFEKTPNRMLLRHGSRLTNWTGILSQGLRIAPPEAPVTGYMFGKGVYFADMVSKSANYCCTHAGDPVGVLLLSEVALGNMNELYNADYNANKLPSGKLSTKGVGRMIPDPKEYKTLEDGVVVPVGKPTPNNEQAAQTYLAYNEYIVYDQAQIRMRYLLQVRFNYKSGRW